MTGYHRATILMVSILMAGSISVTANAQTPWSQYQGNAAHSGFVPEDTTYSNLQQGWTNPLLANVNQFAIDKTGVYTTITDGSRSGDGFTNFNLVSLDQVTGATNWEAPIESFAGTVSAPSLGNGLVYVDNFGHSGVSGGNPSQYPRVMGFDENTGGTQFSTTFDGQWNAGSRPTVLGNQVISLGGYYGGMDSYDATSGNHQWFTNMPQQYEFISAMDSNEVYVYYGAAGGSPGPNISTFYALNRASGAIDYTIQNPSDTFSTSNKISSVALGTEQDALVINNETFLGDHYGTDQVTSFNLGQQSIRWNRNLDAVNALAVGEGMVAVPESLSLDALNEMTGSDLWKWNAPTGQALSSNVIMTNNVIFVASNDTLYGIDRITGELTYTQYLGLNAYDQAYSLAYYDGTLYAAGGQSVATYLAAPGATTVPEPSAILLYGMGLLSIIGTIRGYRKSRLN